MVRIREEIEEWKQEYEQSDVAHKYIMHTTLLLHQFRIEQILEWLKTQPEITGDQYLEALKGKAK